MKKGIADLIREVRANAIWWFIEKSAGAAVITAVLAIVSWYRQNLEIVSLILVFAVSLAVFIWAGIRQRRAENTPKDAGPLTDAPRLLVSYLPQPGPVGGSLETLRFRNEGPGSVVNVELGPLSWEEERPLNMVGSVGTLGPEDQVEKGISLQYEDHGSTRLFDFMRSHTAHDALTYVRVTYESRGCKFSRQFELTTEIDGGITWKPGPVELIGEPAVRRATAS